MKRLDCPDRSFWHGSLVASATFLAGCTSLAGGARADFSGTLACPEDRITVTPRPDIMAHTLYSTRTAPPAEVQADPERRRLWEEQERAQASIYDGREVFQVEGCGHHVIIACYRNMNGMGVRCGPASAYIGLLAR